jgi:hypothetical protein
MCFSRRRSETVVRIRNPVVGSVVVILIIPRPQAETGNPTENDGKATKDFMQYFTNRCYTHIQTPLNIDLSLNKDTSLIQTPL